MEYVLLLLLSAYLFVRYYHVLRRPLVRWMDRFDGVEIEDEEEPQKEFVMPYDEGVSAYYGSIPEGENPYDEKTRWLDHLDWKMGWKDADCGIR